MATQSTRQRIEQFLSNSTCDANVLSALHGVSMTEVAEHAGISSETAPSPNAIRSGLGFERALLADGAARLIAGLIKAGLLEQDNTALLDLRLSQQGGPMKSLEASHRAFEAFLMALSTSAPTVALVGGAALAMPSGTALGDGLLAMDVLLVAHDTATRRTTLRIGEIKSFVDRGGHTDRAALASARAQAGLYLHVLRHTLERLGLSARVTAADHGFLVLKSVTSNYPRVRAPEELRWQAARASRALDRLRDVQQRELPNPADLRGPHRLQVILDAPYEYAGACVRFCPLAKRCHACAVDAGNPVVLGEDTARFLQGVDLHRALALLDGESPANDVEHELLVQLQSASL